MSFLDRMLNPGYGNHPTAYGQLSDRDLFGMYRGEVWSGLNESSRRQLLQETVNRAAASMGEKGSCEVKFADMSPDTFGRQHGSVIEINKDIFTNDMLHANVCGQSIDVPFKDSNYKALETVLHENIHAWQNQCVDGTIDHPNKELIDEYRANGFTPSEVTDKNGVQRNGSQYLSGLDPDHGNHLYYFQSTERDAHKFSEIQTQEIVDQNLKNFGPDETADAYKADVEENGFQATWNEAREQFGYDDFEKDINNTLKNSYNGTDIEVNPEMEALVHNEMAESYDEQHGIRANENQAVEENPEQNGEQSEGDKEMRGRNPETWPEQLDLTDQPETYGEDSPTVEDPEVEKWQRLSEVPFAGDQRNSETEESPDELAPQQASEQAPQQAQAAEESPAELAPQQASEQAPQQAQAAEESPAELAPQQAQAAEESSAELASQQASEQAQAAEESPADLAPQYNQQEPSTAPSENESEDEERRQGYSY